MDGIVQTALFLFINGLIWGLIISLIAIGLSLIFGVMEIVNFAHGDIYMGGAVLSFYVVTKFENFWLSLVLVPIIIIVTSTPLERFVLRPYEGKPLSTLMATLGISIIIQQIVLATYGGIPKKISSPWPVSFNFLSVDYPGYRLAVACISILILIGIWFFLHKTSYGILVRASMQDREMASAMGINVNRVFTITFGIGCVLAAVAGVLASPITHVFYLMGNDVILLAFIVVVVGGLGSIKGTFIISLSLCSLEGLLAIALTPIQGRVAIFIIMILILLCRPQGLFRK